MSASSPSNDPFIVFILITFAEANTYATPLVLLNSSIILNPAQYIGSTVNQNTALNIISMALKNGVVSLDSNTLYTIFMGAGTTYVQDRFEQSMLSHRFFGC